MNTDRIAYFLAVVREGSFSAAAKNMYVSQTAISQQIASLEKEMGCALFHRLSTGAVLTDQGEQFLPYAERLMGIQLELQDAFADAHRVSAIHIGYNGPLEKELIVDAYLSLHPHLPNLVIHPLYLSLTAMSDALYRGQCDMVLTLPGEIDQRNTYQEVLYDVPMIAADYVPRRFIPHDRLQQPDAITVHVQRLAKCLGLRLGHRLRVARHERHLRAQDSHRRECLESCQLRLRFRHLLSPA